VEDLNNETIEVDAVNGALVDNWDRAFGDYQIIKKGLCW
jgi:hypothetical protein